MLKKKSTFDIYHLSTVVAIIEELKMLGYYYLVSTYHCFVLTTFERLMFPGDYQRESRQAGSFLELSHLEGRRFSGPLIFHVSFLDEQFVLWSVPAPCGAGSEAHRPFLGCH